ncbi:hypothetical protein [Sphingomonas segetis]|jgi:hypothetical protein|uniref:hypothetical protein n=1 Tax=Sphingomonas segetis TaxID=1104779 RepID=UPI0012D36A03|nr:hypothetical protein [Sphingomonas segetis]
MMMISAIVAVALGLTPVTESKSPQLVEVDDKIAARIGKYEQLAGRDGKTRVRGFDRLGRAYDLSIDANGHVTGQVGNWEVTFDAADAV